MEFFCATTAKQAFIFAGSTIFSLFDGMLRPCSDKRLLANPQFILHPQMTWMTRMTSHARAEM